MQFFENDSYKVEITFSAKRDAAERVLNRIKNIFIDEANHGNHFGFPTIDCTQSMTGNEGGHWESVWRDGE